MKRKEISWAAILAVTIIFGVLITGMLFYLNWAWATYGRDYALSSASLFVAIIVGLAVIYTLKLTRDSLVLPRATTRPFLTLEKAEYDPHMPEVILYVRNTGALPANEVLVESFFMTEIFDDMKPIIISGIKYPLPSIFPQEEKIMAGVLSKDLVNRINSGSETRIIVKIKYRSTEKECETRRTLRWPTGRETRQHPLRLEVLEEGNYWD